MGSLLIYVIGGRTTAIHAICISGVNFGGLVEKLSIVSDPGPGDFVDRLFIVNCYLLELFFQLAIPFGKKLGLKNGSYTISCYDLKPDWLRTTLTTTLRALLLTERVKSKSRNSPYITLSNIPRN